MQDQLDCVIVIGLPGSGKTTCGKLLSKRLGYRFIDSDKLIERSEGMPVREIFSSQGEPHFRMLERDVLRFLEDRLRVQAGDGEQKYVPTTGIEGSVAIEVLRAIQSKGLVLAVGGGMPEPEENRQRLKRLGTVVYLFSAPNEIAARLKEDGARPLLAKNAPTDAKVSISHKNQSITSENMSTQKISSRDVANRNKRDETKSDEKSLNTQSHDSTSTQLLNRLESLLDRRRQAYESADITIDTSGLDPHQIVNRLQEALKTHQQIL